ncbi:MAG: adenylate/guanylate cyclase domain-containing protein [Bacteriovoracaceae bacterium]|nr:adenylate/guanylate cyclase domain-containing protein [Bacteriovoracaceae bacterium]
MLNKIIRIIGIFLIVSISTISVFLSVTERDLAGFSENEWMSLPSFFEDRFFDFRVSKTLDDRKDPNIVLVKIDDKSLKSIGRWPWTRTVWADVIDKLGDYGAKVVAFDVFFSEPERACTGVSPDVTLGESIKRFQSVEGKKVILPYSLNTQGTDFFKELPESLYNVLVDTKQDEDLNLYPNLVSKTVWPVDELVNSEALLGHIEAEADVDGVFRHIPIIANVDELYLPSYALLSYQAFTGKDTSFEFLNIGDSKLKINGSELPVNFRGEVKVRWLGNEKNFFDLSISDLLKGDSTNKELKKLLKDKLVFIASTSYGAHDLRNTPVDAMLPGVYMHMNIAHMLMEEHYYQPASESTKISWILLITITSIILLIQLFHNAILDLIAVLLLAGGSYLLDTYYLIPKGYEVRLFFCLFSVIACYMWTTFINFYHSNKDKAFLKNAFGNYISPELIDQMHSSKEPPKLGGDVGILTAYFTDIQGFSTFSEKLSAPKLVELLNEYLTAMTDILLEEGGTLDKYEGDAIIAFFGAPMPLEDHATRACRVAVRMQNELLVLRKKWLSEGDKWPQVVHDMKMRIGINSGEIVTGNMGSRDRMNYTMMGDSVNLAARLEEAAKQYGIFNQVSEFTKAIVEDNFLFRQLDTIQVVGKSEPVTTFDLMDFSDTSDAFLHELKEKFEKGIELYKSQKWDEAIMIFEDTLKLEHQRFPELTDRPNPSLIYLERCGAFKKTPPPSDWNGVFTLTSK